jgi:UDP-glucose 4-epimerase
MTAMTKVAVTGGAGFIGSNLTRRLLSESFEVSVVDDLSTGLLSNVDHKNTNFFKASVTDREALFNSIKDCETIFHFAARGSVPRSIKNPIATHDVNATGTLNVLEVARATGAHVIFSSSSSVYGRNLELPKNELMWLGPLTPYAASKLSAEGYMQAFSSTYAVRSTILRFFNVFGPYQRPDHEYAAVLPKWIWLAMQDKPIDVYGDGTASRDFTYIDTVLDIAMTSMKSRVTTEGAVNLAYGNRISLNEVINYLKDYFPDLKVNYKSDRLGDVKESLNSPLKLKSLFPDITPVPFESALRDTVLWLREFGHSVANGPSAKD